MRKLIPIPILIFYILIIKTFVKLYTADINYSKAQALLGDREAPRAFEEASLAITKNPSEPLYYEGRAKVLILMSLHQEPEIVEKLKSLALEDMKYAYILNSKNLVTIRNLVPIYYFLAEKDITAAPSLSNVDPIWKYQAANFFEANKNISPNDVGVYALLAKYEKRLSLTEGYNFSVNKVRDLRPDILDWYDAFK